MKLKDAINLVNKRDGKPPLRFDYDYAPGIGTPVRFYESSRTARNRLKASRYTIK